MILLRIEAYAVFPCFSDAWSLDWPYRIDRSWNILKPRNEIFDILFKSAAVLPYNPKLRPSLFYVFIMFFFFYISVEHARVFLAVLFSFLVNDPGWRFSHFCIFSCRKTFTILNLVALRMHMGLLDKYNKVCRFHTFAILCP